MVFENGTSSSRSLPREDSPLLPNHSQSLPLSSLPKSFGNILIAIVGAGVLGLPYTFMKTGWFAGLIMLGTVAGITYYCMMLLVWTKRKLESDGHVKIGSFGDVGFLVSGSVGKAMVDSMIVLSQAGFCVGYLIFIGNSLSSLMSDSESKMDYNSLQPPLLAGAKILGIAAKPVFIWAVFPFQLGLNAIRTLTHLAPFSIFADVVDIAAMLIVMVEDVLQYMKNTPYLEAFTGFGMIPYGIGVAIYAFEGIGMMVPLEVEADKKHKFGQILGLALFFIAITYGGFGLLGYCAFGSGTRDIITLNMGRNWVTVIVQVALCLNLFFTFPLMMNPVHEVGEQGQWGPVFFLLKVSLCFTNYYSCFVGAQFCRFFVSCGQ